ncbi:curved DNA-binding protein Cdb4 [Schizosaccharomyces japonicus yFS275]|uniref:Curved DNA-binding protein Cdb4 n=1 Tax=Schizosaccharomyces japonicus (strain yFS275 / FY16936) TaxID=402676 RepID=B6JVH1_SCHJY|nr:curved DNA-binding protein Cdb4 [Schizosaccharomyces japonicus yFS275]EEB05372.1 curved DNA-binding protein Cdb4 [Schizosaccharomyces japonicus yFS275]
MDSSKKTTTTADAPDYTLANPDTLTKYKAAAEISQNVLKQVVALCVEGAKILDICVEGDKLLLEALDKQYRGKKITKGIAFPTAVSPNHIATHLCPIPGDDEASLALKTGDLVKVSLGAQIDGFASVVATSIVISKEPVSGRAADAVAAASVALKAAQRLIKPGNTNWQVTETVDKIAAAYDCKPLAGMLTHQQLRNVVDGKKQIILNPSDNQRREFDTVTFEEGEVYGVDILVSTSADGKVKRSDIATRIYKKTDTTYLLKLQASRKVYHEIQTKFGAFPFPVRSLENERKARMGIQECVQRNVLLPYEVLVEKEGEYVAEFFSTIALTKNGTVVITDSEPAENIQSTKSVKDEEILKLLQTSLKSKNKKKRNNKKKAAAAPAAKN